MPVPAGTSKNPSRICLLSLALTAIFLFSATPGRAQQTAPNPASAAPAKGTVPPKANPEAEVGKAVGSRPPEAPAVLKDLNSALESLVARVAPAVVQILVTGYGPIEESNRAQTALIARQHAVGSGVIVGADGYIMTNAHVVEGAHRIRVVLPMPSLDFPQVEPVGKEHVVARRVFGI